MVLSIFTELYSFLIVSLILLLFNFVISSNVINLEGCFSGCTNLTVIPKNFTFSQKTKNLKGVFENCINLSRIPETLWPDPEFELETTINFANAFAGCISATGTVPMYKLWYGEVYWNPVNTNAFENCSKLTNYNYIPISWGGKGEAYTNLDFELTIPDDGSNKTFALPLHKIYTAYDFVVDESNPNNTNLISQDINAQCKILINWGDGTDESYIHISNVANSYNTYWNSDQSSIYYNYLKNFPTAKTPNDCPSGLLSGICHTYKKPGKYMVSIIDAGNYYDKRFNIYVETGTLSGLYKLTNEFETDFERRFGRSKYRFYIGIIYILGKWCCKAAFEGIKKNSLKIWGALEIQSIKS